MLKMMNFKLCCIPKILKNESNSQLAVDLGVLGVSLCCIPKILKNESNSQPLIMFKHCHSSCVVSQRYSKMKAIHNVMKRIYTKNNVVLYPKDTQK